MRYYLKKAYAFALVILIGCIDPLDKEVPSGLRLLTVEGGITTEHGPHKVKLTRTARYGNVFNDFVRPEEKALVSVRDNFGNVEILLETAKGVYETSASFRGEVGRSYTLQIITAKQEEYTSLPELISPVPVIDSLSYSFRSIPTSNKIIPISGFDVFAHFKDDPNSKNYYMWRSSGTHKFTTRPDLYVSRPPRAPAPKSCCDVCWKDDVPEVSIRILSDQFFNGNNTVYLAAFVEDNGMRFTDKYLLRIRQFSLSEQAYQFFKLLNQQLGIEGSIFDPPPATIGGNMISLNNLNENVIGFFTASAVSIDSIFLFRSDLEFTQLPVVIPDDCREVGGTTQQPSYW